MRDFKKSNFLKMFTLNLSLQNVHGLFPGPHHKQVVRQKHQAALTGFWKIKIKNLII